MSRYFEMASKLYQDGDKVSAFNAFLELAIDGDADAQAMVAYMLENAEGCESNLEEAIEWYKKAADQGQPIAHFNLGQILRSGKGGTVDESAAFNHFIFMKAAHAGNLHAMFEVAQMLEYGVGTPKSLERAATWYETAAKYGHTEAQNSIGAMYQEGYGVPQDYAKAFEWYEKAANEGHPRAMYNLGMLYDKGWGVERDHDKALEWCRKAAHAGHEKAKGIIRHLQEEGKIVF